MLLIFRTEESRNNRPKEKVPEMQPKEKPTIRFAVWRKESLIFYLFFSLTKESNNHKIFSWKTAIL